MIVPIAYGSQMMIRFISAICLATVLSVFQVEDVMAKDCTTVWDDPAPLLTVTSLGKVIVYSKSRGQIAITQSPGLGVEPQTIRDVNAEAALAFDQFMSGLCLQGVKDNESPPPGGPDDIEISFEHAEPIRLGRVRNTGGDFLVLEGDNYTKFHELLNKL